MLREIPCEPLDVLKGTEIYPSIVQASAKYQKGSVFSLVLSLVFLVPLSFLFLPIFLGWLLWFAYSIYSFFQTLLSLSSSSGWANFDLVGLLVSTIVSFIIDLIVAAAFVVYSIIAVWAFNSFRIVFFKNQNIATKALVADTVEEVKLATTPGLFGFFFKAFEGALNRCLSIGGGAGAGNCGASVSSALAKLYPKGALVLRTPAANWPVIKSLDQRAQFKLLTKDVGDYLVVALLFDGGAQAIGIFKRPYRDVALSKIKETNESM